MSLFKDRRAEPVEFIKKATCVAVKAAIDSVEAADRATGVAACVHTACRDNVFDSTATFNGTATINGDMAICGEGCISAGKMSINSSGYISNVAGIHFGDSPSGATLRGEGARIDLTDGKNVRLVHNGVVLGSASIEAFGRFLDALSENK